MMILVMTFVIVYIDVPGLMIGDNIYRCTWAAIFGWGHVMVMLGHCAALRGQTPLHWKESWLVNRFRQGHETYSDYHTLKAVVIWLTYFRLSCLSEPSWLSSTSWLSWGVKKWQDGYWPPLCQEGMSPSKRTLDTIVMTIILIITTIIITRPRWIVGMAQFSRVNFSRLASRLGRSPRREYIISKHLKGYLVTFLDRSHSAHRVFVRYTPCVLNF